MGNIKIVACVPLEQQKYQIAYANFGLGNCNLVKIFPLANIEESIEIFKNLSQGKGATALILLQEGPKDFSTLPQFKQALEMLDQSNSNEQFFIPQPQFKSLKEITQVFEELIKSVGEPEFTVQILEQINTLSATGCIKHFENLPLHYKEVLFQTWHPQLRIAEHNRKIISTHGELLCLQLIFQGRKYLETI